MKKILSFLAGTAILLSSLAAGPVLAAVTVSSAPVSLITSPVQLPALSAQTALFTFSLNASASENLTGVSVQVDKAIASTTVSSGHLASVSLYKDDGSNVFNPIASNLIGSQNTVNIGSTSTIAPATTTPANGKFYVSLATSAAWTSALPTDSIVVTLPANALSTSATTTPTTTPIATAVISANTQGPVLISAVAQNTGGTSAKEVGDSIALTFSKPTNQPVITSSTLGSFFTLNNGHSFLDSNGNLGSAAWSGSGTILTFTLSGSTTVTSTLPTVLPGDTVSLVSLNNILDATGNHATGSVVISGTFGTSTQPTLNGPCSNGLTNGKFYQLQSTGQYYLAAHCLLKPFNGRIGYFYRHGKKFKNVIVITSLDGLMATTPPVVVGSGHHEGNDGDSDDFGHTGSTTPVTITSDNFPKFPKFPVQNFGKGFKIKTGHNGND